MASDWLIRQKKHALYYHKVVDICSGDLPTCLPADLPTNRPAYQPTCLPAYMSTCLHVYLSTYLIFHLIRNYIIAENNFAYIPTPFYFREGNSAILPIFMALFMKCGLFCAPLFLITSHLGLNVPPSVFETGKDGFTDVINVKHHYCETSHYIVSFFSEFP